MLYNSFSFLYNQINLDILIDTNYIVIEIRYSHTIKNAAK